MPEIPDLTVFAKILSKRFQGKVLERLDVTVAKKLNVSQQSLSSVSRQKLTAITGSVKRAASNGFSVNFVILSELSFMISVAI